MADKEQILDALTAFARQQPGLDPRDYSDSTSYRARIATVNRDLEDVLMLALACRWRPVTAGDLLAQMSNRLTIETRDDGGVEVHYCAAQYYPVEYRSAVARVLAGALWKHAREHCMPDPIVDADGEYYALHGKRLNADDWLRAHFLGEFGARVARRWFD